MDRVTIQLLEKNQPIHLTLTDMIQKDESRMRTIYIYYLFSQEEMRNSFKRSRRTLKRLETILIQFNDGHLLMYFGDNLKKHDMMSLLLQIPARQLPPPTLFNSNASIASAECAGSRADRLTPTSDAPIYT